MIDLTHPEFFANGFPHDAFTRFRAESPLFFDAQLDAWVVTRHADCIAVADDDSFAGGHALDADMRHVLTPALSPSAMRGLENEFHWYAQTIVHTAVERRHCDFVAEVADPMALNTVARLLGVPAPDRDRWMRWHRSSDPAASAELDAYAEHLIEAKRRHRDADLVSRLVGRLPPREMSEFFRLLDHAGTGTTRDAIAHGVLVLIEHPDQWDAVRRDRTLMRRVTEELLRWASPTFYDRRTAGRDVEVNGCVVTSGQHMTLWWASANRDEAVFRDPFVLDVHRDPNPHLAFGHGHHGCLGGTLARMVMRLVLDELVDRCDRIALSGAPTMAPGERGTGICHLPVVLHPAQS